MLINCLLTTSPFQILLRPHNFYATGSFLLNMFVLLSWGTFHGYWYSTCETCIYAQKIALTTITLILSFPDFLFFLNMSFLYEDFPFPLFYVNVYLEPTSRHIRGIFTLPLITEYIRLYLIKDWWKILLCLV